MSSGSPPQQFDMSSEESRSLTARLDRISIWSLSYIFIGIIGLGFLFTFYDIADINVSFVQTCIHLVKSCSPKTAVKYLGPPVLWNLVGYLVGTLIFSPLSDRFGRRNILVITMFVTGVGSLLTAVSSDYTIFVIGRAVTGIGIGADLAIVSTYISEVAPRNTRARYMSIIFAISGIGTVLGTWLGLLLTTPSGHWPLGLPFALGRSLSDGWRWMYYIGALLALVALIMRVQLPESPLWLISKNRLTEAETTINKMESRAERKGPLSAPDLIAVPTLVSTIGAHRVQKGPIGQILMNPLYRSRAVLLLAVWFFAYITVYAFAAGFTSVLNGIGYIQSEAGLVVSIGVFGRLIAGALSAKYSELLERKQWLVISAIVTLAGALVVSIAHNNIYVSGVGAMVIFIGFNLWVPMAYAWSAENFPTQARSTGFALVDGIGHVGGGIGLLVVAPLIPGMSPIVALLMLVGFLVVAAVIAQFGVNTRGRSLGEVSP